MKSTKLVPLVQNICDCCYSPRELTEFIDISQRIAVSYLKYLELNGRNIRPRKIEGVNELEDVAIDCIADLFTRNDKGEFIQLQRYFRNEFEIDDTPDELQTLSMLRRLVVKKTKQELSRIFKERDPEGAKIIRNIKMAIKNSDKYISVKEMGREFVCNKKNSNTGVDKQEIPKNNHLENKKNVIPEKILFHYFLEQYSPTDSISSMLNKMMKIVDGLPDFHNYLAIDLICSVVREVTFQHVHEKLSTDVADNSPLHDIQKKEIYHVNHMVVKQMHQKIKNQYLSRNKITPQKANIYCMAISDFITELTQDQDTDSNYKYLKRYIPGLTQKSYREQERSIFEYLVKVTKKSLIKKLKKLL
jgi:hypothetical protein